MVIFNKSSISDSFNFASRSAGNYNFPFAFTFTHFVRKASTGNASNIARFHRESRAHLEMRNRYPQWSADTFTFLRSRDPDDDYRATSTVFCRIYQTAVRYQPWLTARVQGAVRDPSDSCTRTRLLSSRANFASCAESPRPRNVKITTHVARLRRALLLNKLADVDARRRAARARLYPPSGQARLGQAEYVNKRRARASAASKFESHVFRGSLRRIFDSRAAG